MCGPQQLFAENRAPDIVETAGDARQTQRPRRGVAAIEHRGPETPATFHQQPGIHRVSLHQNLFHPFGDLARRVTFSPAAELCTVEVLHPLTFGQVREDHQPGGRDSEGHAQADVQDVRAQRETALLARDADRLVAPTCRQEGALPVVRARSRRMSPALDVMSYRSAAIDPRRKVSGPSAHRPDSCRSTKPSAANAVTIRCTVGRANPAVLAMSVVDAPSGS